MSAALLCCVLKLKEIVAVAVVGGDSSDDGVVEVVDHDD